MYVNLLLHFGFARPASVVFLGKVEMMYKLLNMTFVIFRFYCCDVLKKSLAYSSSEFHLFHIEVETKRKRTLVKFYLFKLVIYGSVSRKELNCP